MKYEVGPNCCRVCLQECKKLRSIYKPLEDGDESPNEMLEQLLGLALERNLDPKLQLPESICRSCELSLNMAFQFREKALKSQSIIDNYCREQDPDDCELITIKSDPGVSEDTALKEFHDVNVIHCDEQIIDSEDCEEELEFVDEMIDNIKTEEIEMNENDDLPYSIEIDDNSNDDDNIEYLEDNFLEIDGEIHVDDYEAMENVDESAQRSNKIIDNTRLKRVLPKKKPRQIKRSNADSKKNKDESGYICDVCGNIFAKRGRMMEHRRRHDTELRFSCELCGEQFHLREKLRKHMYSHTGSKPYKCHFCSREFFYESVRKAHEGVHRGHKPYVCDVCNKAFAYSHALSKHKLIHAEIKLYHCHYCNKDFRLQHHMKQHEETKSHQNAVQAALATASNGSE